MNIAKISIQDMDSDKQDLYELNKNKSLQEIVTDVCKCFNKPVSKSYGLKCMPLKDSLIGYYVTEHNLQDVKHNDCLKLVFSISHCVDIIFQHIDTEYNDKSFEYLHNLSIDAAFIDELEKRKKVDDLLKKYIEKKLNSKQHLAFLLTILHLLQKNYINKTEPNFLAKVIHAIKEPTSTADELEFCLSVVHKILVQKNEVFKEWKEKIIKEINITQLTPYIWNEDTQKLQYGALLLINTIIRSCKGDKRTALIKEMNLRQNREAIYNNIILKASIDTRLEHELYVCQTYILSLYSEVLKSYVDLNDTTSFKREEFELCDTQIKRPTILMDFDESLSHKFGSVETLLDSDSDQRFSIVSQISETSCDGRSRNTSISGDSNFTSINLLTLEALRHYKKFHFKNFSQSQIEETVYEPGIYRSSDRVMKILIKILHIGKEPEKSSNFYQPIVFFCSGKLPFLFELFSRAMWLLSKTRREMKASTLADYNKVMNVVEKQIIMALETKPIDFKALTNELSRVTFNIVMEKWQVEEEAKLNQFIATNRCVQDMKRELILDNEKYVFKQRMEVIKKGHTFPKILEKKTNGKIFVKISDNLKHISVADYNIKKSGIDGTPTIYEVAEMTHVVLAKNCPHSILCSNNPKLAFSVLFGHTARIDFIADNELTACYWIDAFNLLINREDRSSYYVKELEELVDMDIKLKLLELQYVRRPKEAPKVPPPPNERPAIPSKPIHLKKGKVHKEI